MAVWHPEVKLFSCSFSDLKKTTGPALYVRAIEDAVAWS